MHIFSRKQLRLSCIQNVFPRKCYSFVIVVKPDPKKGLQRRSSEIDIEMENFGWKKIVQVQVLPTFLLIP